MKKFIDDLRLPPSLPARMRVQPFEWWLSLFILLAWIGAMMMLYSASTGRMHPVGLAAWLFYAALMGRPLGSEWKPVKWNSTLEVWETE